MPTLGSLFTGIGGLDLGFERAGYTVAWQVESDPYCQRVLAKHWPHVRCYGDIRTFDPSALVPVDCLVGGFPCQPVSHAGKQKAQDDPRWLWPQFHRLLCGLRPRHVVVENVPGLRSHGLGDVLRDLADSGYDAEWTSLSAQDVGAPHRRQRVFLVAYADGQGQLQQERLEPALRRWALDGRGAWAVEPDVGRMAHGVPDRMDRLRTLGNAVVPQVAEVIAKSLRSHE